MTSSSEEKYLGEIYYLVKEHGYARVSQLAKLLNVSVPSASKMVNKLAQERFINYERYGIITLTEKGFMLGERLAINHQVLVEFFRHLGFEEDQVGEEVRNIEYYISSEAITKIKELLVR